MQWSAIKCIALVKVSSLTLMYWITNHHLHCLARGTSCILVSGDGSSISLVRSSSSSSLKLFFLVELGAMETRPLKVLGVYHIFFAQCNNYCDMLYIHGVIFLPFSLFLTSCKTISIFQKLFPNYIMYSPNINSVNILNSLTVDFRPCE